MHLEPMNNIKQKSVMSLKIITENNYMENLLSRMHFMMFPLIGWKKQLSDEYV